VAAPDDSRRRRLGPTTLGEDGRGEVCTKNGPAMHWGVGSLSEANGGGARARNPARRRFSVARVGRDAKGETKGV
jgi:hypothetical protein